MSSPSPSLTDDEHDSYHPPGSPAASGSGQPTVSKRGRKPAPGSRAAREAQRKSQHSVIEKRRREKINETMSALRTLLADGYCPPHGTAEVEAQESTSKPTKKAQDFKLEVLTRSVDYIHQLLDKITNLETQLKSAPQQETPSTSTTPTTAQSSDAALGKRKRDEGSVPVAAPPNSSRLPSISSLLNPQLPSPPMSAPMRPTMHDIPPILTLPAARSQKPPSPDSANWTPDEEHVASLLLNISSNRSDSPTSPQASRHAPVYRGDAETSKRARIGAPIGGPVSMTPAGMLGLRPASG
ncbi:hypothetical protein EXIGLDRAFT_726461 [Exidia glandulosa HHB12029]|uniref:BHLH domain-containing protein n=1 Tax=Exidia glandulosa HHB12029 TaxID=1314781 RepID=A0A165MA04_EXIGL|nr:hypothetical protein EXIGLDRAFT_726461 [Exidia glandulosa HHB12029]